MSQRPPPVRGAGPPPTSTVASPGVRADPQRLRSPTISQAGVWLETPGSGWSACRSRNVEVHGCHGGLQAGNRVIGSVARRGVSSGSQDRQQRPDSERPAAQPSSSIASRPRFDPVGQAATDSGATDSAGLVTFRVALGVVSATPYVVAGVPDLGPGRIADVGD